MAYRPRPRPLADLVGPVIGPALAQQGFTGQDIIESWPEIVGERLALASRPVKVEWPRRRPGLDQGARSEPATLVVRVEGAFAIDLQHLAPVVIERINAVYGWRCVGRLVLKQGPLGRARVRPRPAEASAEDRARVAAAVASVEAEPLRAALDRLGRAVVASHLALPQSS